jgi:hypothetical protein
MVGSINRKIMVQVSLGKKAKAYLQNNQSKKG